VSEVLEALCVGPLALEPIASVEAWWTRHRQARAALELPFDRAISGGAACDRLGYAFASGYHEALRALVPTLAPDQKAGLCITEEGGAHPKAIQARLSSAGQGAWRLNGRKRYASLATHADVLLVAARLEEPHAARPVLRIVSVPARAEGVRLETMPSMSFVPEIPHAQLDLEDVHVDSGRVLPGDGYAMYIKPFRTVEDVHVHGALLGYLIRSARQFRFGDEVLARLLAIGASLRGLAVRASESGDWLSPMLHLELAGVLAETRELALAHEPLWANAPGAERERWQRDLPLLNVAESARAKRTEVAWQRLRQGAGHHE